MRMNSTEKRKAENEMTDKEREIYISLQKETEFMKIILTLAKNEDNPDRLGKILYNLQIGNRRDYNKDLKGFINGDGTLKTTHKEAFFELIEDNDNIYAEIRKTICQKLGYTDQEIEDARKRKENNRTNINSEIEDPRGIKSDENLSKEDIISSLLGRRKNQIDTKNSYDDFKMKQVKMSLKLSLTSIKTSLDIIEKNLTHINISGMQPGSADAKALASLVRRSRETSGNWTEYLINEKMKKKFILHEDNLLTLFNNTVGPAKRVWEISTKMEKEIIDAGLVNEEEIEELSKQDLSFNASNYWSDSPIRSSEIENDIGDSDSDTAYGGNAAYEEDKNQFLKYKYFDNIIRSEKDIEKSQKGLGIDFGVTKRELITTSGLRRLLNVYYKVPEDMRDTIEKVTKTIGFRSNSAFSTIFGFFVGRISKDPDAFFSSGNDRETSRERHRRFTQEMGRDRFRRGPQPHSTEHEREEQEQEQEEQEGPDL